ncbi:MAG: sugar nucleotide-binding protein [Pseudomonadaceae bacterium]
MRMRVLLLGKSSLLGRALNVQAAAEDIEFLTLDDEPVQWQSADIAGWLDGLRPDAVVDLSFYHQQFQVLAPAAEALAQHSQFAAQLIAQCAQRDLLLCMLSNTRVFDGSKGQPYTEKDPLQPIGLHGEQQAALDAMLEQRCRRHLLLRFSWVLDTSEGGMLQRLMSQLCAEQTVVLAEEWRGNPTTVADTARVVLSALKQLDCNAELYGCYHYASGEMASWISFARTLAQELVSCGRIEREPGIEPVAFESQPAAAVEPRNAVLSGRRLLYAFGIKPRTWRIGLPELLNEKAP